MTPAVDMKDSEKVTVKEEYIETGDQRQREDNATTDSLNVIVDAERRAVAEKRLVRKLDLRLMPMVLLIYIMNYIDRTAVTTARLQGLEQDLSLSDIQYDALVAIVYGSYCPAQIPSNMVLNYVKRPSWYIGVCAVLWGVISALTGTTRNFSGIMTCRFFLGIPESAFYPGTIYLLSRWYTRKELAFRCAVLYSGLLISNAFGSLMAAGILSGLEGKMGIRGWKWLFFVEGAITIFIGFLSIWVLPDYPADTRWLSPADRHLAQARLAEDAGEADQDSEDVSLWEGLKLACKDYRVHVFSLLTASELLGSSFINFFPTLTSTLGFNTTISLLLVAPPWIYATIVCWLNAFHADKTGERFFHVIVPWLGVIIGYIIGLSTFSIGGRYVAMFLMASGYAGSALPLVWTANTFHRPPTKRAAAIAIVNGFGTIGNLLGAFVWKAKWGPAYHQSMTIGIAALSFSIFLAFVMRCILIHENKKRESDEVDGATGARLERIEEFARLDGITLDEAMEKNRAFRYLY